MAYVFVLPHPSYASVRYMGYPSQQDRSVFDWGADWANQVVRRSNARGGSDAVHVMPAVPADATHDRVLSATVEAYRAAARQAGRSFGVQLAPSGHLNVTELHLEVLREMRRSRCATPRDLAAIDSIGEAIRGVQHLDFYSCEIGTTSDGGFLANLSNYWHASIAALRGTVVLSRAVSPRLGPVDLAVRRDGRDSAQYRHSRPPESLWARANNAVYETPLRPFGEAPLTCRDFRDGR